MRRQRSALGAGLCLLLLIVTLCFGVSVHAAAVPELRGGWYPWAPYQYKDTSDDAQKLTGLDVELFREIFERQLRLSLDLPQLNWDEHQKLLQEGSRLSLIHI